jgi:hypothetical protein
MRSFHTAVVGGVLVLLLVAGGIVRAEPPLDAATIGRWVDAMQELQAWGEQHEDLSAEHFFTADGALSFERSLAGVATQYLEVARIIEGHGFRDAESWGRISGRIINAFMALRLEQEAPAAWREMEAQLRALDDIPHLSAEQRELMRQQMRAAIGILQSMSADVSPEDLAAVKQSEARLSRMFDESD